MAVPVGFAQEFRARLAAEVSGTGWAMSPFDGPDRVTLTRPLGDGFEAVVQMVGCGGRRRGTGSSARVYVGTAYGPATALMPRLTLPPEPLLVATHEAGPDTPDADDPEDTSAGHGTVSPEEQDEVCTLVREAALEQAPGAAAEVADLDALEDALRDEDRVAPARAITRLPVLLAATGRVDEARAAVEDYLLRGPDEVLSRSYRRFAHQLGVWAEAGAPPPPPLEAWPAHLFHPPAAPRPDPAQIRRAGAPHDAAATPPPGLWGLLGLARTAAAATVGLVAGLGRVLDERPDWLEPPDHALFPVPADEDTPVPVTIDPDSADWLGHVAAVRTTRTPLLTHCDAWLEPRPRRRRSGGPRDADDPSGPGEVVVHLGSHAVGRLSGPAAALYAPALRAAARYGELPQVGAHLLWSPDPAARRLSLDRPDDVVPPPF